MGAKQLKTQLHFNGTMPLCSAHWPGELTSLSKPTRMFPVPFFHILWAGGIA